MEILLTQGALGLALSPSPSTLYVAMFCLKVTCFSKVTRDPHWGMDVHTSVGSNNSTSIWDPGLFLNL